MITILGVLMTVLVVELWNSFTATPRVTRLGGHASKVVACLPALRYLYGRFGMAFDFSG